MEHKWWHFIYGKEIESEVVFKTKKTETQNSWDKCKKCGQQIGEKWGSTTFGPMVFHITDNKNKK